MEKKERRKYVLLLAAGILILGLLLIFQDKIKIETWPCPLWLSRTLMILLLLSQAVIIILSGRGLMKGKKAHSGNGKDSTEGPAGTEKAGREPLGHTDHAAVSFQPEESSEQPAKGETDGMKKAGGAGKMPGSREGAGLPEAVLEDLSFIEKSVHTAAGPWQQYDYLLASRGYGWDYMVSQADYMAGADLEGIGTITVSELSSAAETELIDSYHAHGNRIADIPEIKRERAMLAIGGMSRALRFNPVKIVWYNQTRVLRIFTPEDDDDLLLRYTETLIRRSFGTEAAMKKARPVPDGQS